MYRAACYPDNPSPLGESFRLSIEGYDSVVSPVIGLGNACGPNTIFRRVSNIIVYPFYGEPFRRMTHVRKEVIKYSPPVAYRNPPGAVVSEPLVCGIVAPLNHSVPSDVYGSSTKSVGSISIGGDVGPEAPTRLRTSMSKGACSNMICSSTVAFAHPQVVSTDAGVFDSGKPSKSEAGSNVVVSHFSSPRKSPFGRNAAVSGEPDVRFRWPSRAGTSVA